MQHFPYLSLGLPHRRAPGEPPSVCQMPALVSELQVCSRRKDCSNAAPAIPTTPAPRAVLLQDSVVLSKAQAPTNLFFALQFPLIAKQNTLCTRQSSSFSAIGAGARALYPLPSMQKCSCTHPPPSPTELPHFVCVVLE